jgi:hypothetical protein
MAEDLELAFEAMYADDFGDAIATVGNVASVPEGNPLEIAIPIPAFDAHNAPAPRWVRVLLRKNGNGFSWAICTTLQGYNALVPPPVFGI